MQYSTEEVQRVIEAKAGVSYIVDGCVCTTATYGETFRPITRYRFFHLLLQLHCSIIALPYYVLDNLTT